MDFKSFIIDLLIFVSIYKVCFVNHSSPWTQAGGQTASLRAHSCRAPSPANAQHLGADADPRLQEPAAPAWRCGNEPGSLEKGVLSEAPGEAEALNGHCFLGAQETSTVASATTCMCNWCPATQAGGTGPGLRDGRESASGTYLPHRPGVLFGVRFFTFQCLYFLTKWNQKSLDPTTVK